MKEIRYETPMKKVEFTKPTMFLAGPTVRGNQPHLTSWRFEACRILKEKGFDGDVIIPEFTNKIESDKYRYDLPVWEFEGLTKSHAIMFWIPRTKELIGLTTNHEFGYWMVRDRNKVVYGRPDDAYRMKYLDIMWVEDAKRTGANCPIYNTLEKTVEASIKLLEIHRDYWMQDDGIHCPVCGVEMGSCHIGSFCDTEKGGCGKWCDGSAHLTNGEAANLWSKIIH